MRCFSDVLCLEEIKGWRRRRDSSWCRHCFLVGGPLARDCSQPGAYWQKSGHVARVQEQQAWQDDIIRPGLGCNGGCRCATRSRLDGDHLLSRGRSLSRPSDGCGTYQQMLRSRKVQTRPARVSQLSTEGHNGGYDVLQ